MFGYCPPNISHYLNAQPLHRVPFFAVALAIGFILEAPDEVAHDFYLLDIVSRDLHASEVVFNRQHQLNAVEKVGSEVVCEVRFGRRTQSPPRTAWQLERTRRC